MEISVFETLPSNLRHSAWRAGNGEPAWPLAHALEVAAWCVEHDFAIVGGEVYEVLPGTQWGSFRFDWVVLPSQKADEQWAAYVERAFLTAELAIASVGGPHDFNLKIYFAIAESGQ